MRIDITGNKYNKLLVLGLDHRDKGRRSYWKCLCECGNETIVEGNNLKRGTTKSCGCFNTQRRSEVHKKDLKGQSFSRLVVLEDVGRTEDKTVIYDCVCSCGNHTIAKSTELRSGHIRSCGCLKLLSIQKAADKNRIKLKTI